VDTAQALIFFTQQKNQTAKRELSGDKKIKHNFILFDRTRIKSRYLTRVTYGKLRESWNRKL
jgi:hypothetical protein